MSAVVAHFAGAPLLAALALWPSVGTGCVGMFFAAASVADTILATSGRHSDESKPQYRTH